MMYRLVALATVLLLGAIKTHAGLLGHPVTSRPSHGSIPPHRAIIPDDLLHFPHFDTMQVYKVRVHVIEPHIPFRLQIWRWIDDREFSLIHETEPLYPENAGFNEIDLEDELIIVDTGDVMGFSYEDKNPIVYSEDDYCDGRMLFVDDWDSGIVDHDYEFEVAFRTDCRNYSLELIYGEAGENCRYVSVNSTIAGLEYRTPGFPGKYSAFIDDCVVFYAQPSSRNLTVVVENFQLENRIVGVCWADYAILHAGDQMSAWKWENYNEYCANDQPGPFVGESNIFTSHLYTDDSDHYRGFKLKVYLTDQHAHIPTPWPQHSGPPHNQSLWGHYTRSTTPPSYDDHDIEPPMETHPHVAAGIVGGCIFAGLVVLAIFVSLTIYCVMKSKKNRRTVSMANIQTGGGATRPTAGNGPPPVTHGLPPPYCQVLPSGAIYSMYGAQASAPPNTVMPAPPGAGMNAPPATVMHAPAGTGMNALEKGHEPWMDNGVSAGGATGVCTPPPPIEEPEVFTPPPTYKS